MSKPINPVQGHCTSRFALLREKFSDLFDKGEDVGASLAVSIDGEFEVDLWGGWADEACSRPWQRDTLTNVWSITKTMTALSALVLADRGELDLDAPVARYWPEFGAAGKQGVLVRHLLAHMSGVAGWDQPMTTPDMYDWDRSVALLAAQAPWWPPGTATGYHGLNYGHLVGEVVRRVTGMGLGRFFAEQIAAPLGADFHIGLSPSQFHRVANVIPPPPLPLDFAAMDPSGPMFKMFSNPAPQAEVAWTDGWRSADLGAVNGHGNAHSVALVQSVVACGGTVNGVRLLSPRTVERIFETQCDGIDLVLGMPLKMGIGYGLPKPAIVPFVPDRKVCFWSGWGGSFVIVDVDRRATFAYVMNKMAPGILAGPNVTMLAHCFYDILDSTT